MVLHRQKPAVREAPDFEGLFRCPKTVAEREGQHLDDHLYPLWQDKKLNELTKVTAQTLYEDLLEGDRSPDMVRDPH